MYVHLYVCPLNIWMHMLLYQLQGQPMEGVCSGGCRGCWGVEMSGRSLVPSCPIGLGAAGSPKPLPGWAEPRSRKISQILKRSRDRKSLSHPALITGWPSSLPAGPTRVPRSGMVAVPIQQPCAEDSGDAAPATTPSLHPKNNLSAVKKPTGAVAVAPVGFFTARRLFLGISPAHGFAGGSMGMGTGAGGPSLPPPIATLPAGMVSGLLAANRALAVLALADASGYNRQPETSPSRRME